MEIKTIAYSKSYEMVTGFGLKHWEKIALEADVTQDDDTQLCLKTLKDQVEAFHKEHNKEVGSPFEEPVTQVNKPSVKLDPDEKIIEQYKQAVANENESKITLMETIYNPEKLKNAIKEQHNEHPYS